MTNEYAKDKVTVFTKNSSAVCILKTIDYNSFKIVKGEYAKDKNQVFYDELF